MPLEVEECLNDELQFLPWENAPYGVVSLLDVLDFSAKEYIESAHRFGLFLGDPAKDSSDSRFLSESLSFLLQNCHKLGLAVTQENIVLLMQDMVKESPQSFRKEPDGFRLVGAQIPRDRMVHHIEAIYSAMRVELGSMLFKAIPRDRSNYASPKWLEKLQLVTKFPTSFTELERSGMCYALGQPTASVFHSMRALEPGLAALAKPFEVSSTHENWQNIINDIEKEIRKLGNAQKTQQRIDDETFFGGAVSHLYFVKNAWRNHVAHTRESYGDDEAHKILQRAVEFIESLCPRLQE
jgi:hypothetical protein